MYGPKMDEITEDGWSLHAEMVHDLHCSEYFGDDKNMKVFDEACSAYGVQVRCIYNVVVKREEICTFERPLCRRKN